MLAAANAARWAAVNEFPLVVPKVHAVSLMLDDQKFIVPRVVSVGHYIRYC